MDVKTTFSQVADVYDRTRRQLVPEFDAFYGASLEIIPFATTADIRILDLGAGTGLNAALVGAAFPNARLTLADFSPQMLDQARRRFADRPNVEYLILDFEHDPIPGEYDVIVSALAIHHTPHVNMPTLFAKIYGALAQSGIFVNTDQALGTSEENEARYEDAWLRAVKANGSTDAEIDAAQERKKADKTATLEDQLAWMRQVGFTHVDCWYKHYRFVVYSGRKL